MTWRHFLITDPVDDERVLTLAPAELVEVYTPDELARMADGAVIFKLGALHVDMHAAARKVTDEELMG